MDVDYLGDLPFRTSVSESADKFDQPIVKSEPESAAAKEFMKIAETIKEKYMTKD